MIWDKTAIQEFLEQAILPEQAAQPRIRFIVYRMLQAMFKRQTAGEQAMKSTRVRNGVGFTGFDAPVLSDIAEKSRRYESLTPKQTAFVAKRLRKYAGQLEEVALAKQAEKVYADSGAKTDEAFAGAVAAANCVQCGEVIGDPKNWALESVGPMHLGCSDIYWSNEAAKQEAAQEAAAYMREIGAEA